MRNGAMVTMVPVLSAGRCLEATDVNFFVGRAVNPAHQDPNLPISFNIKMKLVEELSELLRKMGKRVKVMYF